MTALQSRDAAIKDLRIRCANLKSKLEIREEEHKAELADAIGKLNGMDGEVRMLQAYIARIENELADLKEGMHALQNENSRLNDENGALLDLVGKLKLRLNKNSSNSSKPPSTDTFKKPPPSSSREKSGKKQGGQPGHKGHGALMFEEPDRIIECEPAKVCGCGGVIERDGAFVAKQTADIICALDVLEARAFSGHCTKCGKIHCGEFPDGFVNPIQYGSGIKSFVSALNVYANVSVNKTAEMLANITGGALRISDGTVVNIVGSLAKDLTETAESIKQRLIECEVLSADETGVRVDGKLGWMQVFCNDRYTLFGYNSNRGAVCIEDMDILVYFTGVLVHDHFKTYYKKTAATHAECNEHILRYLKNIVEIMAHGWASDMRELLKETNQLKKQRMADGAFELDCEELARISESYSNILETGLAEYNKAIRGKKKICYYNDERLLLNRLKDFKAEHLRFITDFKVPFGNNTAEQACRIPKGKQKSAGCFRSEKGIENYARIASVVATLRKQKTVVFDAFRKVFCGEKLVFSERHT